MSDTRTIAVYDARAQTYAELVARDAPDADLQAFLDAMPAGGQVLDLGCGPGNSAALMRDAGLEVEAWDASAQMVQLARRQSGVAVRRAEFDDLKAVDAYDGIWANFSLLHAPKDAMQIHLAAIRNALKPGGHFHIGLKTGEDTARDRLGRLYTYYTVSEITGLIEAAGFTPRRVREGIDKGLSGEMAPFVVILSDG